MAHLVNTGIVLLISLCKLSAVPHVACPHLFEYIRDGAGYFGRITLSNLTLNSIRVDVRLVQEGLLPSYYIGHLIPGSDLEYINSQINRGEPVKYHVNFPLPNKPPKLLRIAVNENELCAAPNIPPPFYVINLYYTIVPVFVPELRIDQVTRRPFLEPPRTPSSVVRVTQLPSLSPPSVVQLTRRPTLPPTISPPSVNDLRETYSHNPFLSTEKRVHTAQQQCGRQKITETISLTPLIIGGIPIDRGQFPWLSAIYGYMKTSQRSRYICGGTLISRGTVISAAHCFRKFSPENIVVYLGRHNLEDNNEGGYVSRGIKNLMVHSEFKRYMPPNPDVDIAILHLDTAVEYTEYITPICLWSGPDEVDRIARNRGTVAGWGAQDNDNKVASLPQMVNINIASRAECLRYSDLFRELNKERMFCAGNGDDSGPCVGDSGSGFMMQRNGVWMLRGIVSVGPTLRGTCNPKEYAIYCDVAKHMLWIKDNTV